MGLSKRRLLAPSNPTWQAARKRRRQLRAIHCWLRDLARGEDRFSLKDYCRGQDVSASGITKLLQNEKVQERLEKALSRAAGEGLHIVNQRLLAKLEHEDLPVRDLKAAGEHLAKMRYGGYRRDERQGAQATVAVQINLPAGFNEEDREKVETKSREVFGSDLME